MLDYRFKNIVLGSILQYAANSVDREGKCMLAWFASFDGFYCQRFTCKTHGVLGARHTPFEFLLFGWSGVDSGLWSLCFLYPYKNSGSCRIDRFLWFPTLLVSGARRHILNAVGSWAGCR